METHSDEELRRALETDATVIGVNARDLETLEVDVEGALARVEGLPADRIWACSRAASRPARHVDAALAAGASAILVGETLMRAEDPARAVTEAALEGTAHVTIATTLPDARGRFGTYGGRYVPEVLIPALDELAEAWSELREDAGFRAELSMLSETFVGRPTPITPSGPAVRTSSATRSG